MLQCDGVAKQWACASTIVATVFRTGTARTGGGAAAARAMVDGWTARPRLAAEGSTLYALAAAGRGVWFNPAAAEHARDGNLNNIVAHRGLVFQGRDFEGDLPERRASCKG